MGRIYFFFLWGKQPTGHDDEPNTHTHHHARLTSRRKPSRALGSLSLFPYHHGRHLVSRLVANHLLCPRPHQVIITSDQKQHCQFFFSFYKVTLAGGYLTWRRLDVKENQVFSPVINVQTKHKFLTNTEQVDYMKIKRGRGTARGTPCVDKT